MKKNLLFAIFLIANTFSLFAQAPVNNTCAGSILLTPSTSCVQTTGTLSNATASASVPSCRSNYTSDVYYKFVANAPTTQVNVVPIGTLDPIVAVYSSCGGSSVNCTDIGGSGGSESLSLTGLIVGNTYFVQVAKYGTATVANLSFTICVVSTPVTPVNNACASAILLTPSTTCVQTTGTVLNATASASVPSCRSNYTSDVYYKFVANAPTAQVNVTPLATLDPILAVYSSCGGSSINCTDVGASGGSESLSLTGLIVGNTYFVQVAKYGSSIVSDPRFTICVVSTPVTPVNNECAGAIVITPSTTCVQTTGTLSNATASATVPSCRSNYTSDVYFKFVANAATAQVNVVPLATLDPILAVYSSCGGSTVSCTDAGGSGGSESLSLTGLVVGNTYFIQVAKYGTATVANPGFTICVVSTPLNVPVNDECAGAISVTPSSTCVPQSGSLQSATTTATTTLCNGYYDVFYKFTATATSATITLTTSNSIDAVLGVYTSCNATSSLTCQDAIGSGVSEVANLTNLTIGSQYFIKVSSYWATLPTTNSTFSVCVQSNSTTTATQSSAALSSISLYPNPTHNILNIENISASTKIELIDMTGKIVFSENIDTDTQLNVSNYSAGVYILKLSVDGVAENRRVVISK